MRFVVVLALFGCKYDPPVAGTPGDDAALDAAVSVDVAEPPPGAWLDPWTHRKAITIHGTKVSSPSGGLIDFPVAIVLDDPEITAMSPTKTDVVFTAGDAMTLLASDNEVVAGNALVAWVKVPLLEAGVDTRIYLYYGNSAAPAPTPTATWTAGHEAVWHLHQNPMGGAANAIQDATTKHPGQAQGTMTAMDSVPGKIGLALDFDGTNDCINIPSNVDVGNQFTISAWVNFPGATGIKTIFSNSLSGLNRDGFRLFVNSDTSADRRLILETSNGNQATFNSANTEANTVPLNAWAHIAAVIDRGAGLATLYINSVDLTVSADIRNDFLTISDVELGRMEDDYEWIGQLDQFEIATVLRPPQWIRTSFVNQDDPSSFYVVGAQELAP